MIVLSENGKSLIDATNIYVAKMKDREDQNKVNGYRVLALNNNVKSPITVCSFMVSDKENEETCLTNALKALSDIADGYGA